MKIRFRYKNDSTDNKWREEECVVSEYEELFAKYNLLGSDYNIVSVDLCYNDGNIDPDKACSNQPEHAFFVTKESTGMNYDGFVNFVRKQKWIFAKTYATRCPHEYIVRGKINGQDSEFMEAVQCIQDWGITMQFYGRPNKYLFVGDKYYWVMTDNMQQVDEDLTYLDFSDPTTIINRANVLDYRVSVRWKGVPR